MVDDVDAGTQRMWKCRKSYGGAAQLAYECFDTLVVKDNLCGIEVLKVMVIDCGRLWSYVDVGLAIIYCWRQHCFTFFAAACSL